MVSISIYENGSIKMQVSWISKLLFNEWWNRYSINRFNAKYLMTYALIREFVSGLV